MKTENKITLTCTDIDTTLLELTFLTKSSTFKNVFRKNIQILQHIKLNQAKCLRDYDCVTHAGPDPRSQLGQSGPIAKTLLTNFTIYSVSSCS